MFKVKDLICLILVALSVTISSCSKDEPESPSSGSDNNKVVINSDGSASGGAVFSRIDGNTFWLDYVKYKIVDSHLEIIGYDATELPQNPTLYSEVTLNGANLKTRIIEKSAFENAKCTTIKIPEGVTQLKPRCFAESAIESISISSQVTELGYGSFSDCSALRNITFEGDKITKLPEGCFAGTTFESFSIPSHITQLGEGCFMWCSSLKKITFEGDKITELPEECFKGTAFESFSIPSHIYLLGEECFAECRALKSIDTGNMILGTRCFAGCSSLEEVTLNDHIPHECFYGCYSLKKVICNAGVYHMMLDAFDNCSSLKEIYFYGQQPPRIDNFYDLNGNYIGVIHPKELSLATAYVPKDLLEIYLKQEPFPYEGDSFCTLFKEILPIP